jgi:hypothetical protein
MSAEQCHRPRTAGGAISLSSELSCVSNGVSAPWRRCRLSRHGVADYGGKREETFSFESTACRTIAIGLGIKPANAEDIPLLKTGKTGRYSRSDNTAWRTTAIKRRRMAPFQIIRCRGLSVDSSGSSMRQLGSARAAWRLYYECIIAKENAATRQGDSVVSSARVHQQCCI